MSIDTQLWIRDGLQALQARSPDWSWDHGDYVRDFANFYRVGGKAIEQRRTQECGDFNPEWLPWSAVTKEGSAIMRTDGTLFNAKSLRALGTGSALKDYVRWQWEGPLTLRFTPSAVAYPLSNAQAKLFREVCNAVVGNYPALLRRPDPPATLRLAAQDARRDVHAEWAPDGEVVVTISGVPTTKVKIGCQADLTQLPPVRVDGSWIKLKFLCAPGLTKLAQVWTGEEPWRPSARRLRRCIKARGRLRGTQGRDTRTHKWQTDDPVISHALASIDWKAMLKAPSLSAQDSEFWHKLRLHQLYTWATDEVAHGCSAEGCTAEDHNTTGHIIWRCRRSQALWQCVFQRWGAAGEPHMSAREAIFSWQPPHSVLDWLAAVSDLPEGLAHQAGLAATRLEHWLGQAWIHLITTAARLLWPSSVGEVTNFEVTPSPDLIHVVMTRWRRRRAMVGDWTHARATGALDRFILRKLAAGFADPTESVPRIRLSRDRFLLFFDGGSRGNPDPGGSGAVIVRARDSFDIMWMAAMSYAGRTTTNNFAEFQSLIVGLQAAVLHQWHPLTVIGDSAMIISLMRRKNSPKAHLLQPLFQQARQAAASLRVTGWHHHYHAQNKMADKAANIAMDARRSLQVHAQDNRAEFAMLQPLLANDVEPWTERLLLSQQNPDRPLSATDA